MGRKSRVRLRLFLAPFALVLLAASTTGCKKLLHRSGSATDADGGAGNPGDPAAAQQEAAADEQIRAKLNNYIDCMNALSNPVLKSRDKLNTYFPTGAITGKEVFAEVPKLAPDAASTCMLHVTMGRSLPPADPKLESSGLEFADAAAATDELTRQMASYLDARAYKKDKWEKGKALYPQLTAAWKRFAQADTSLHVVVATISRPLEERALARIERAEGKKFAWHKKNTILASRRLMDASDPVGEDKDVDLNVLAQSNTDYEKALDDLAAYGTEHKSDLSNPLVAENHSVADANYRTFTNRANELKKAAKEYSRCLREAPPKAHTPAGKIDRAKVGVCGDGTVVWTRSDELIAKFNQLIGAFNSLPFP